jgi:hypothetical protein
MNDFERFLAGENNLYDGLLSLPCTPVPHYALGQVVNVVDTDSLDALFLWVVTARYWMAMESLWDYALHRIGSPERWTVWGESHLRPVLAPVREWNDRTAYA